LFFSFSFDSPEVVQRRSRSDSIKSKTQDLGFFSHFATRARVANTTLVRGRWNRSQDLWGWILVIIRRRNAPDSLRMALKRNSTSRSPFFGQAASA